MRRRAGRRLSEEETALWAHVTSHVKAYPGRRLPAVAPPPTPPAAADEPATASPPPRPASRPAHPAPKPPAPKPILPLDRKLLTALKRGHVAIDGVIDLHGLRQDEAHRRLIGFLRRAQADGARTVLVITGKGAASAGLGAAAVNLSGGERGVLRRVAPHWLRLPDLRPVVMGFEEASLHHGGEGALYVRLRRQGAGSGADR